MPKNEVTTKSTCGLCGKVDIREGAEPNYPPVGWFSFTLSQRLSGSGWTNHKQAEKQICSGCGHLIADMLHVSEYFVEQGKADDKS